MTAFATKVAIFAFFPTDFRVKGKGGGGGGVLAV